MKRLGFGKRQRLLDSSEFSAVFDENQYKVSNSEFLILARESLLDHPRIGLVVAKKHLKKAHQRNLVKRVVRESFRLNQENIPPLDMVILARQGIAKQELKNNSLYNQINPLWKRLVQKQKSRER